MWKEGREGRERKEGEGGKEGERRGREKEEEKGRSLPPSPSFSREGRRRREGGTEQNNEWVGESCFICSAISLPVHTHLV